jgi:predicted glycosyltransferase
MEVEVLDKALLGDEESFATLKEFINSELDGFKEKYKLILNSDDRNDIIAFVIEDLVKYRKTWEGKLKIEKMIKYLIKRVLFYKLDKDEKHNWKQKQ